MSLRFKRVLVTLGVMLAGVVAFAGGPAAKVLWLDFDMKNIPEPKEREVGSYEYFFEGQLIEGAKQNLDLPRWVRQAAGRPKQAANVNAVDEVPDSSWYTNRHHLRRMTLAELQRGPDTVPPDFRNSIITKAKTDGVTPGFMLKDKAGESYLVKFDDDEYPNLRSGAEVIATKILYAAGYNVPENYIAYIDPSHLQIGEGVEITDVETGKKRPLTKPDVNALLGRVARSPDGRYRVLASKILKGKPKGPFPQFGFRKDDPNDLIPHEHRRELRGLRAIASWIDNWDLKESQSLDMYVDENGRKFLRHYLIDFGSSLGAAVHPEEYFHGKTYGFDAVDISKEIFTLGLYESPTEKRATIISPEIGRFTADEFEPEKWKPSFGSVMFNNMTDLDAFWATRVILSFTEAELRAIIATGEYSDSRTSEYVLQTLMKRQQIVARHWLSKVDALADFSVRGSGRGVAVSFRDLMTERKLVDAAEYAYQVKGEHYKSPRMAVRLPEFKIDREVLAGAIERAPDAPVEISIWPRRPGLEPAPVRIYFDWNPTLEKFTIRRIARG